jgi:Leucine-rich repeat (LRR) protein
MTEKEIWWFSLDMFWKNNIILNCKYSIEEIDNNIDLLNLITSITIKQKGIKDISPIQHFSNLKYLNLSENLIEDITPINALIDLEYLNLSENNIKNITPIFGLTKLKFLFLNEACRIVTKADYQNTMSFYLNGGGGCYTANGFVSAKDLVENIRINECTNENGEIIGFDISPLGFIENLSYLEILDFPCYTKSNLNNIRRLKFCDARGLNVRDLVNFPYIEILEIFSYGIPQDIGIVSQLEELSELKILNCIHDSSESDHWLESYYPEYFK